ncbi:hypothetical protein BHM03_00053666 [Ensete ventricosum]|nr:hypothetical protein BHM03_00053666 [Ensete ventricosum]
MAAAATLHPKTALTQNSLSFRSQSRHSFLGGLPKNLFLDRKPSRSGRKGAAGLVIAAAGENGGGSGRFYFNFTGFPFPLGPFLNRRTIRTEVSLLCSHFQLLTIVLIDYLLCYFITHGLASELNIDFLFHFLQLQLLKELNAPVEYIVLPTFAYEHKIFVGPFSRKFPRAQVWVAPRQWSWPINLPLEFFGIFRARALRDEDTSTPWADEIEQKILSSPEVGKTVSSDHMVLLLIGIGPYVEVAFYHRRSRTLLVTDAVIYVPRQPPACISKDSLLASAKNGLAVKILSKGKEVPDEPVVDNKLNRQKGHNLYHEFVLSGWERMVLQILFLGPSNLLEPTASFAQMSQKLIVSPIVKTLVFSKVPEKVRDWVDRIAKDWPFRRIITAHFAAPINASRSDFLAAFGFLDEFLGDRFTTRPSLSLLFASVMGKATSYFPPDDMKTLSSLDQFLVSVGAVKKTVSGRIQ